MTSLPPQRERKSQGRRVWVKRATIALPLLCLLIFAAVISVRLVNNGQNAGAESYTTIKGQVPGLVKTSTLVGPTSASQSLSISVGLQLRNVNNLKSYVDSMTKPKSVNSHKHLTAAEITAAYAPLASSQQAVIDYLQGYGFQVTSTGKQHLVIGFNGTVGDAEKAFQIQINNYTSSKGMSFYAPATDPSVPLSLAGVVQNIAGLDNSTHLSHPPVTRKNLKSNAVQASVASCPATGTGYFLPSQIAAAYNLNSFYSNGFNGEGQVVALLELDTYQQSDITAYTSCFGGGSVPISKIAVDGGAPAGPGAIEVELDMELILSAAPKLANLEVYEAPNDTWAHYLDLWSRIINDDSASVISTSWGSCEAGVPSANLTAENNLFLIAEAQGQTIFAASGDDGTNDCGAFLPPNGSPQLAVDDPASQPYVTGVGGTTLTMNGNAYGSETAWNDGPITVDSNNDQEVWAGGGGISNVWTMPSYQSGSGVNNSYTSGTPCSAPSGNCREVPDVSLNADPNTAYAIYCSIKSACSGFTWLPVGGTSAAAPMWAAFMALTNEKTVRDGGFNIGFINPYLYQIDQNAGGTSYSNDFHDITTGNNDGLGDGGTTYSATADYDMATGLGSFNAWNLAGDLEKLAKAQTGSRGAPANTLWYFAEGAVGGGFEEFITLENPSTTTANVTVEYLFTGKAAQTFSHPVNPNSRLTVSANTDLKVSPGAATLQSISLVVTSTNGVPIVVERPMYFNFRGVNSGSDVIGTSNVTHTNFYFAQGDASLTSNDTTREYITVLNPQTTAATITATFYSGGKLVDTKTLTLPPLQRGTMVTSYHHQAAIQVTSTVGVVVERPMYVTANIAAAGGTTTGAASIIGATDLASEWLFAEGNTGSKFQEYLVISNFTTSAVQASVKLEYTNGTSQSVPVTVNAQSQLYFDVNNANKNPQAGCGCTPTNDVAADITAPSASLVVERVTYFHYNGESGLTDVLGQAGPASKSVYSFAEGTTVGQFQEFLALSNPTAKAVQVAVTMFVNGAVMEQEVTVPAYTCEEININTIVKPMIAAYAPHNADVSMVVQSFGGPVVAERVMYFSFHTQTGGTDIIGYTGD